MSEDQKLLSNPLLFPSQKQCKATAVESLVFAPLSVPQQLLPPQVWEGRPSPLPPSPSLVALLLPLFGSVEQWVGR